METRPRKKSRQGLPLCTIVSAAVSVLVAIVLSFVDRGPPLPPWPKSFKSIDCHSVSFDSFTDRGGFLDFKFKTDPSVEYPPDYLPHFLTITIDTPPTRMTYSGDQITNITRTETEIKFSIVHTWAGPSRITTKCLDNRPTTFTRNLTDIANWIPQYSRSDDPGADNAKFQDVCLEFEKFLYFVQFAGDRPAVPFDSEKLRFEMLKWPLDAYLNHKKVKMTKKVCFLVAPLEKTTWKMVLLTLLPLSVSVDRNAFGSVERPLFIFRKEVPAGAENVLSLLGSNKPVKLDDIMCFDTLLMTSTFSKLNILEPRIENALGMDFGPIRRRIPTVKVNDKKVVLADNLWDAMEFRIKERLPSVTVERLGINEEDVHNVIQSVSSAKVLVGDHISSLVHMLWMKENQGVVIDMTPEAFSCNPWAEAMAKKIRLTYKTMFKKENCTCASFRCYEMKPPALQQLDYDKIIDEIANIFSSV